MPISLNFRAYQQIGRPSDIFLEDLSTGTDSAVTERRVYFQKEDGTFLVQKGAITDYILWPLNISPLPILNILDKDYALNIIVSEGNPTPYIFSNAFDFTFN